MKANDKVLIGIVVGIVVLIIVALVITITKPDPVYLSDDTPEGVAHNYLLALQQEDYKRAYGYLSPTILGYPHTQEDFISDVQKFTWNFSVNDHTALSVQGSTTTGSRSTVTIREASFFGGDLFSSGQSIDYIEMDLRQVNNQWKIEDSDDYFAFCWATEDGCKH